MAAIAGKFQRIDLLILKHGNEYIQPYHQKCNGTHTNCDPTKPTRVTVPAEELDFAKFEPEFVRHGFVPNSEFLICNEAVLTGYHPAGYFVLRIVEKLHSVTLKLHIGLV